MEKQFLQGGILVNVTGSRFSNRTEVRIDGNICQIVSYSYNLLTCIVPPNVRKRFLCVNFFHKYIN
jgi:hypothetical protein